MATPEQQRRTAEMSRILAANGWGVINVRNDGAAVTITARKARSAIRELGPNAAMPGIQFLVGQFRWEVTAYDIGDEAHTVTIRTT